MIMSCKKLHLGCGSISLSGWINVDLDSPMADQQLDLAEPLPFSDSSVSHIFNEHFIEHIARDQAVSFLKECFRVLVPDGVIRISTPNLRFLANTYITDKKDEWGDLWQPNSRCQLLNEGMRAWGHQFLYDAEELIRVLFEAGFKLIEFQNYRLSTDSVLSGLESRPFHNELIVEARKSDKITVEVDFQVVAQTEAVWQPKCYESIAENSQSLLKSSLESAARAEFIEVQTARINEVEAILAKQVHTTATVTKESAARAEFIEMQTGRIREVESALEKIQSSWCGKIYSLLNR